jgi:hypothetical protein
MYSLEDDFERKRNTLGRSDVKKKVKCFIEEMLWKGYWICSH